MNSSSNISANQVEAVKSVWARHETFHPRYGWFKKGFDFAAQDPNSFTQADASVKLGVGKNMVKAIRYWCNAFKVLDGDRPTDFGYSLLADEGYDPYLENPASVWLLHWYLLKPTCMATAWYYTFNLFRGADFYAEDLIEGLESYLKTLGKSVASSSVKKDITCILRMYVNQKQNKNLEDYLDSPFRQLRLIQTVGESRRYRCPVGLKPTLPAEIIIVACLEYASWSNNGAKTVALSRLMYDAGSPGMIFKLSEEALYEAIEIVAQKYQEVTLSDTAGLIQFSFKSEDPKKLAQNIIKTYYCNSSSNKWHE